LPGNSPWHQSLANGLWPGFKIASQVDKKCVHCDSIKHIEFESVFSPDDHIVDPAEYLDSEILWNIVDPSWRFCPFAKGTSIVNVTTSSSSLNSVHVAQ
jgi:hypothetical protein